VGIIEVIHPTRKCPSGGQRHARTGGSENVHEIRRSDKTEGESLCAEEIQDSALQLRRGRSSRKRRLPERINGRGECAPNESLPQSRSSH
jgi:hypothetical protein